MGSLVQRRLLSQGLGLSPVQTGEVEEVVKVVKDTLENVDETIQNVDKEVQNINLRKMMK